MFDEVLDALDAIGTQEVRTATLNEIADLCKNPVFRILCDLCDVLHPRKVKK